VSTARSETSFECKYQFHWSQEHDFSRLLLLIFPVSWTPLSYGVLQYHTGFTAAAEA